MDMIDIVAGANRAKEEMGGSSGITIPHFDLAAMGVTPVELSGSTQYHEGDFSELKEAMRKGLVSISFSMVVDGMSVDAHGVLPCYYSDDAGIYQGCTSMMAPGGLAFIALYIDSYGLNLTVIPVMIN